jgi:hypothetical protein
VTTPDDDDAARAQSASARPVEVRIMCIVENKMAFEEALAVFLDGQELPGGYVFSVHELDVPMIPVVRMEPEARS